MYNGKVYFEGDTYYHKIRNRIRPNERVNLDLKFLIMKDTVIKIEIGASENYVNGTVGS
jgi:hypothetical protein